MSDVIKELREKAAKIAWVRNTQTGRVFKASEVLAMMAAKGREELVACEPTDAELVANGYEVKPKRRTAKKATKRVAKKVLEPEPDVGQSLDSELDKEAETDVDYGPMRDD